VTYTLVMAEQVVRFIVRLSPGLHAALTEWAKEERRSLNAQIAYVLERAVADRRAA
jgi:hypothetical protein